MNFREKLEKQLNYYYVATDISLQLSDEKGRVLRSYGEPFAYCEMIRKACGSHSFCEESHQEGAKQASWLKDGYIYDCFCGLVHFSVPVIMGDKTVYHILAGPVALEYPDILIIDQIIETYGCSLNYRKKLYGALNGIPVVEPIRLQYLNELLHSLVKNLAEANSAEKERGEEEVSSRDADGASMPVMKNALRYMEEHYREDIRLGQVAKYIGLNPSYFSTLFRQEMGINFSQYLTKKRIDEACRLLKETNMSLVAIAAELGFDNQSYFSRTFRKQMGTSPKIYRQNGVSESFSSK